MKQYLTIVASILVSGFLFVPIMEFADANDYNILSADPATGLYRYIPNSSFRTVGDCYENTVTVNNLGFHGPPVFTEKGNNTFRIILIGSSYVSAIQVPVDQMFATLLEDKLNASPNRSYTYEVIPIAIGGHSKMIDTSVLDAQGNIVAQTPKSSESKTVALVRTASRNSKFLVNLYNRFLVFKSNLNLFLSAPFASTAPPVPISDSALEEQQTQAEQALWQSKEKMLSIFARLVAKDGAQFLYASWTSSWVATSTSTQFPKYGQKIAERNNFPYVDLAPAFWSAETASGRPGVYRCDAHWNDEGNRYIADAFFLYLTAHPALLSKKPL